jgi:hypothetical protein
MAFTNAERVSIRKFCGYCVRTTVGLTLEGEYGNMEYRLDVMDDDEVAEVRTSFIVKLQTLEDGILGSADNMDTQQAAVWTRNPKEMQERTSLYNALRIRLCGYIGVVPGPAMGGCRIVRC